MLADTEAPEALHMILIFSLIGGRRKDKLVIFSLLFQTHLHGVQAVYMAEILSSPCHLSPQRLCHPPGDGSVRWGCPEQRGKAGGQLM